MLKLLLLASSIHNRSTLLFLFLVLSSHGYHCHQLVAQQQQLNVLDQQAVKTNSLIDSSALLLSLLLANNGSLLGSYSDSKFGPVEDPELEMTTVSIHFSFLLLLPLYFMACKLTQLVALYIFYPCFLLVDKTSRS